MPPAARTRSIIKARVSGEMSARGKVTNWAEEKSKSQKCLNRHSSLTVDHARVDEPMAEVSVNVDSETWN